MGIGSAVNQSAGRTSHGQDTGVSPEPRSKSGQSPTTLLGHQFRRDRFPPQAAERARGTNPVAEINPDFPLAHRMDLPEHERAISAEALKLMREGIAQARAGQLSPVPASVFEDDEDEDE
jgi:hypothetical protein